MRGKIVSLIGTLLLLTCVLVVSYEVMKGTLKYLDGPVANKIYTAEAELPVITICPQKKFRMGTKLGLERSDFAAGRFLPEDSENVTAEEVFTEALEEYYYLLDITAKKDFCKVKVENGEETRVYTGQANVTVTGKACLAWTNITHEYGDYVGTEDFNYCRNPGKSHTREWCFFSSTEFEDCGVRTCEYVEVKARETHSETGLAKVTLLKPFRTTINDWSKCASYDLKEQREQLTKIEIRTPVDVAVYFHSKDQLTMPKELRARIYFGGFHSIEVTEEKTIDLNQNEKPCYNVEENGGKNYGEHEYEVLMAKILEKFNCTTLFIPAEIRKDSEICLNETTANMIHEYLKYSSSAYSTNMWKSNFYTIPPCVYHTFTIARTVDGKGKKIYRYIEEGKLNKDTSQGMYIYFNSKMVVTEQFWAYGFLAYIAEMGGFVGLFLGYSVLQLKGFLPYIFYSTSKAMQ